jgi:hypothetical protein
MSAKNVKTLRAAHEGWNKRDFAGVINNAAEGWFSGRRAFGSRFLGGGSSEGDLYAAYFNRSKPMRGLWPGPTLIECGIGPDGPSASRFLQPRRLKVQK